MRDHGPGTVGVLTNDLTRYAWAMVSLRHLALPPETQMTWVTGAWISKAVNRIIASMRPQDAWVCLLTDDNPCPVDLLFRLLAHEVPIVAPVVCLRIPPYNPSMFHQREDGTFACYTWPELDGQQGLVEVASFGGPGVVIRREVLETVGTPFFENHPGPLGREEPHEDLYTFGKVRRAGYPLLVDLDCRMGHCIPAVVTPDYEPGAGRWGVNVWSHASLGTLWPGDVASVNPEVPHGLPASSPR